MGNQPQIRSFLAVLVFLPSGAFSQQAGLDAAHLSPTLYFSSAAEELESRNSLHVRVEPLVKEIEASAPDSLPKILDAAEKVIIALQRHAAYLRLQTLEDTQDQALRMAGDAVVADRAMVEAAMKARLVQAPRADLAALGRFAYLAEQAQRDAAHAFSPDTQRYRASVIVPMAASVAVAYHRLVDGIGNRGVASQDMDARRAAIARRDEAYDRVASSAAAMLADLVELQNRDAAAQGYANAAERKYNALQLSDAAVRSMLASIEAESPVYRRYEQVLAEHAANKLGVSPILPEEKDLGRTPSPRMSLTQAGQLILNALEPLGAEYTRRFAALLDPANGRLDLNGGNHRARTGTSIAVYDAPVAFFYTGFDGSLFAAGTIAHEGGHAIHRELMNAAGIAVCERTGPHFLFEGYAIFNELLLFDHAAQIAKTATERANALEGLLWKLSVELFVSAEETAFERSLYLKASGHAPLDRAQIDAIYRESVTPYENWPPAEAGLSRQWMSKSLVFEDPLYLINYLYAATVAVALYDRAKSDHDFAAKYERLLRRGFDAEPQTLLATMGIRLGDPELVKAASRLLSVKTEELKQVYRAQAGN
jgi:oligoendopeptidase F